MLSAKIISETVKRFNGVAKKVQMLMYPSTGAVVQRVLPIDSNIPEMVTVIREPRYIKMKTHIPSDEIHNQEYLAYLAHSQMNGL